MARLIPHRPFQQISVQYQFATEIQARQSGKEERETKTGNRPAVSYAYNYLLGDDESAVEEASLLVNYNEDILLPMFHEEEGIWNESTGNTIQGEFQLSAPADVILITPNNDYYEHHRVVSKSQNSLTLEDNIKQAFPYGSFIVPLDLVEKVADPQMSRYQTNLAQFTLVMTSKRFEELQGSVSFPMFNGVPLLEVRPLNESLVTDIYNNANDVVQYQPAGRRAVFSENIFPAKSRQLSYQIGEDRAELEKWKSFVGYAQGMLNTFYIPTYRNDLKFMPTGSNGTKLIVENTEGLLQKWNKGWGVFVEYDEAIFVAEVVSVRQTLSTKQIHLEINPALPVELQNATDVKVGLLELCRLNNDVVELGYGYNEQSQFIFDVFMDVVTIVDDYRHS